MKIRVISDLHIDVNKACPFSLPKDDDVFTVLAGDTSGNPKKSILWIQKNVKRGVVVAGNHIVYNNQHKEIEKLRNQMADAFPMSADVTFLECVDGGVFSKVVDGVLFLGSCLYTDMKWVCMDGYEMTNPMMNRRIAANNMNDFKYGLTNRCESGSRLWMRPQDYEHWFSVTVSQFDALLTENEKSCNMMPCFVVTHHAPSGRFIPLRYKYSNLNASYVSDLEWFIEKHKSIKCWACGHIHSKTEETFVRADGSKVLLLNNPRGYERYGENSGFDPNLIVDTGTWSVIRSDGK